MFLKGARLAIQNKTLDLLGQGGTWDEFLEENQYLDNNVPRSLEIIDVKIAGMKSKEKLSERVVDNWLEKEKNALKSQVDGLTKYVEKIVMMLLSKIDKSYKERRYSGNFKVKRNKLQYPTSEGCFRCDSKKHFFRDCPESSDFKKQKNDKEDEKNSKKRKSEGQEKGRQN